MVVKLTIIIIANVSYNINLLSTVLMIYFTSNSFFEAVVVPPCMPPIMPGSCLENISEANVVFIQGIKSMHRSGGGEA